MPTWTELEQDFRELAEPLSHVRLDYQWGAAGTYYRLAGIGPPAAERRFELLAAIAGNKLTEVPEAHLHDLVMLRRDPVERWYEAVRHHSGLFEHGLYGWQEDGHGNHKGNVLTGTINDPSEASAIVCLYASGLPAQQLARHRGRNNGWISRLNAWLVNEKRQRGVFWAVTFAVVIILLSVLPLL